MPFFNPNAYYNPFANQGIFGGPFGDVSGLPRGEGIFGVYSSPSAFIRDLKGVRTPVTPNPVANVGQSAGVIDSQLAAGGPTFNTATQLNNAAAGGTGGGAGGAGQAAQGYGILPWLGVGLYGLNTLGNLYLGHEALNQGWAQFRFQRDLANQNLANAIQAYNTARRERLRGRGGLSEEEIDRLMEEQGLKDTRKRK